MANAYTWTCLLGTKEAEKNGLATLTKNIGVNLHSILGLLVAVENNFGKLWELIHIKGVE